MLKASQAKPKEYPDALNLLFGHLPPNDRKTQVAELLGQVCEGELSLEGLALVRDEDELTGVMLTVLQNDGTAMMFPPILKNLGDLRAAESLLRKTSEWFESSNALLAQCLLEKDDQIFSKVLKENGYPLLAELVFLRNDLTQTASQESLNNEGMQSLENIAYSPESHAEFESVLQQTYIDSLDCPELTSIRSAEDALKGHRQAGKFHPELWRIYRSEGKPVGLCLSTSHSDGELWELVYLGVVPEFRGTGWGRILLRECLLAARTAHANAMTVAVDAANEPATRLYAKAGFQEVLRKDAHLRWKSRECK